MTFSPLPSHAVRSTAILPDSTGQTPARAQGCKCRECYGLAEYMLQSPAGHTYGLPVAAGHDVPAVTDITRVRCDGTLTCACTTCASDRAARVKSPRPAPRQPWELEHAA